MVYKNIIISQEDKVFLYISKEEKPTNQPMEMQERCGEGLSITFQSTKGASETRMHFKTTNTKLKDVTRYPRYWIKYMELPRGDLRKLNTKTDET